jgi:RNA recognition motif-containing protein
MQQLNNGQSLIASVIAANTTCSLNNTLFVGNLHASLQEIDLVQVFRPFGRIVECCKKWLHFGFVKFTSEEEACHAYVTLNGFRLKGRPMRLEFQNRTKKVGCNSSLRPQLFYSE